MPNEIAHSLEKLASEERTAPTKAEQALEALFAGDSKVSTSDLKLLCSLSGTSPVELIDIVKGYQERSAVLDAIHDEHAWSGAAFDVAEAESALLRHDISTFSVLAEREWERKRLTERVSQASEALTDATREVRECLKDGPADVQEAAKDLFLTASTRARDEAKRLASYKALLDVAESRSTEEWEALSSALKRLASRYRPKGASSAKVTRGKPAFLDEAIATVSKMAAVSNSLDTHRRLAVDFREKLSTTVDDDVERLFERLATVRRMNRY